MSTKIENSAKAASNPLLPRDRIGKEGNAVRSFFGPRHFSCPTTNLQLSRRAPQTRPQSWAEETNPLHHSSAILTKCTALW